MDDRVVGSLPPRPQVRIPEVQLIRILDRVASMNKISLLLCCLSAFMAVAAGDDVVELSDHDFDGTLEEIDTALVMFYAPW